MIDKAKIQEWIDIMTGGPWIMPRCCLLNHVNEVYDRRERAAMKSYVATVNVPGYLPMSDDPPVFTGDEYDDPIQAAWECLYAERERDLDDPMNDEDDGEDQCLDEIQGFIDHPETGVVFGRTPGSDSDYDLGLAYSVTELQS